MQTSADPSSNKFVRDSVAWLSYLMIGTYCYASAGLGPAMTFLREELHLSYTLSAFHFSLWSCGVIVAGLTGDKTKRKFGVVKAAWGACLGLCCGIAILLAGQIPALTIAACFVCGVCGSTMSQTMCTIMAERFQHLRAIAITEANIAASLFCSLAPLLISWFSRSSLGWRTALILPIFAFVIYFFISHKFLANETHEESLANKINEKHARLPKAYWLCFAVVFLSVASEWSILYWTADFLKDVIHLSKSDAAACVTSFLVAMVFGRIIGSRLARQMKPHTLLRLASILGVFGFFLFWNSKIVFFSLLGLFITGLGISNFYPLTLSLAIASAPGQTSQATFRMSLSSGSATLSAPLLLGILAGQVGIHNAYGVIAVLLVICCGLVFLPIWSKDN